MAKKRKRKKGWHQSVVGAISTEMKGLSVGDADASNDHLNVIEVMLGVLKTTETDKKKRRYVRLQLKHMVKNIAKIPEGFHQKVSEALVSTIKEMN